jgi:secernin
VRRPGRTIFGKNSDRPIGEPQVVERYATRPSGGELRTQYLSIPDTGAYAVVGSRPDWLWGFEHGVNEHRVAIGNERVWTVDDAALAPPALIGMDLVRLGLERARTADQAVDVIADLLRLHGQGGIADAIDEEAYFSSFLIADPSQAWIMETSGRTWAAKPLDGGGAISNRISLSDDWERASDDIASGTDFDVVRDQSAWAAIADIRLACTLPAATATSGAGAIESPADMAALLRHHGERPWGRPGDDPSDVSPLPHPQLGPNAEGVTVCMHVRGYQATAASMIAELPVDPDEAARAWVALGSPCASVYVPILLSGDVPSELAAVATWERFDRLRQHVESDPGALRSVRERLGPLEARLWRVADDGDGADSWNHIAGALDELGV